MGLFEQAELFEHRHIVPDGRGGNMNIRERSNGLGADRLTGCDVFIHNSRENPQLPVIHAAHLPSCFCRLIFDVLALCLSEC